MATVIDELVTVLGFDVKSGAGLVLTNFSRGVESIAKTAAVASASIIAAATAVAYFVEKSNSSSAELWKLKDMTGMSAKALQDWSYAAEQAGGTAADIQHDILSLTKALHPTMPGQFNEGLFQLLGPDYLVRYKTVKETLFAVADAIKGMPKGLALNYLAMSGISESSYHLLKKGAAGVNEMMKGSPFDLTDAQLEKANNFHLAMKKMEMIISRVGASISADLAPFLTDLLLKFEKWITINGKLIQPALKSFISGVGDGFKKFGEVISWILKVIGDLIPSVGNLVASLSVKELISAGTWIGLTALIAALIAVGGEIAVVVGAVAGLAGAVAAFNESKPGDNSFMGDLKDMLNTLKVMGDELEHFWDRHMPTLNVKKYLSNMWSEVKDELSGFTGLADKAISAKLGVAPLTPEQLGARTTNTTHNTPQSITINVNSAAEGANVIQGLQRNPTNLTMLTPAAP